MDRTSEYCERLIRGCNENNDKVIMLLYSRGFLIEKVKGKYILSEESHYYDQKELNTILTITGVGRIYDRTVFLNKQYDYTRLYYLFETRRNMAGNASDTYCSADEYTSEYDMWSGIRDDKEGIRIAACELSPNIALYVKAVNSCGVRIQPVRSGELAGPVVFSLCNNDKEDVYQFWHKCLWEIFMYRHCSVEWNEGYTVIDNINDYETCHMLYRAADILFRNRILLRLIKQSSIHWITKEISRLLTNSEIRQEVMRQAVLFFNYYENELII